MLFDNMGVIWFRLVVEVSVSLNAVRMAAISIRKNMDADEAAISIRKNMDADDHVAFDLAVAA
jgi:hypothetical protein